MLNSQTKLKVFTPQEAIVKAENFCAYQERSQYEVRNKLYEWGLHQTEVEIIISELIENNFLNEERFSLSYTLGKFRIKGWGKVKIRQGLKLKRVPDKLIQKSLQRIDPDDYIKKLDQLLDKKMTTLRENDPFKRRYKLIQYAASRGFETDLISDILKDKELE
ncbi:RecX family transcriptional regulator [Flavihumibacter sp. R14]|nr:RecX family transcriptional regulator [Flavihumibacter soli]